MNVVRGTANMNMHEYERDRECHERNLECHEKDRECVEREQEYHEGAGIS